MARVVVVHGIANEFSGPTQMLTGWGPALVDGVVLAGGRDALALEDVGCCFYGDVFRPAGRALGDPIPGLTADDVDEGVEFDLLMLWWEAAARVDPQVVAPGARTLGMRASARTALLALSGSRFLSGLAEPLVVWALKQVAAYFRDPLVRAAARQRFAEAVGVDTRVVVAHSLGSVVAYEGLCALPGLAVTDLVTVGSPLGVARVVLDRLDPPPTPLPGSDGVQLLRGVWPGGVRRWVNISDAGDFVALQPRLREVFGDRVVDVEIHNGVKAHQVQRYLSAAETGSAVLAGLR